MANLKMWGILVIIGGFLGFILAVTADMTGLSINKEYGPDVIGPVQYGFVALGIVIAIIGVILMVIGSRAAAREDMAAEEYEEIEAEEYECPSCGATVTAEATACQECGEVFEREEYECPSCGAIVEPDSTSCPECGEEFEAEGEAYTGPGPAEAPPPPAPMPGPDVGEGAEEEEIEEYECPSCGAAVGEDDTVCPNCGEEFE